MKTIYAICFIMLLYSCNDEDKNELKKALNKDLSKTWILITNKDNNKLYFPSSKTFEYPIKLVMDENCSFSVESCGIKNGITGILNVSADSIEFEINEILDYGRPIWESEFEIRLNKLKYSIRNDTLRLIISDDNWFNLINSINFDIENYRNNIPSDTIYLKESC